MTKVILLENLKEFARKTTCDLLLPVKPSERDRLPDPRPADVYAGHLPEFEAMQRKAPCILLQVVTGKDVQHPGTALDSAAVVRMAFCVYHPDEQAGGLALLNLMEQLRIALLERVVVGGQFRLDLQAGLETLVYDAASRPTHPYYLGEMVSVWHLPSIKRLDADRIVHGMAPWDPNATTLEETFKLKGDSHYGQKNNGKSP